MPFWKNLSVIRKTVQLLTFVFMLYGSAIVGFYATDKLSQALPALSCAYDSNTGDYCTLIPFQHQMDHRIGATIKRNGNLLQALMPFVATFTTFLVMFVVLNKAFCGWVCPLGFFQEILNIIGTKLGLQQRVSLSEGTVDRIRPIKWAVLGLLVFGFPLLTGLGFLDASMGSPFCSICPSRIMTTLLTGDVSQLYVDTSGTGYMILSIIGDFLFGLMIALGLSMRQPFCRVCPMLALHAVFRKIGLVRLVKSAKPRCEKCGLCAKACPMDIREIHTEMYNSDVLYPDCTLCGRCVEFCPDKGVLALKYATIPIFTASPAYFKERNKAHKKWQQHNWINHWRQKRAKKVQVEA